MGHEEENLVRVRVRVRARARVMVRVRVRVRVRVLGSQGIEWGWRGLQYGKEYCIEPYCILNTRVEREGTASHRPWEQTRTD